MLLERAMTSVRGLFGQGAKLAPEEATQLARQLVADAEFIELKAGRRGEVRTMLDGIVANSGHSQDAYFLTGAVDSSAISTIHSNGADLALFGNVNSSMYRAEEVLKAQGLPVDAVSKARSAVLEIKHIGDRLQFMPAGDELFENAVRDAREITEGSGGHIWEGVNARMLLDDPSIMAAAATQIREGAAAIRPVV